ncbi:hypothetical protein SASPL_145281 [Salvia splendens]|uniref:AAA+ ATPase domain-containing protein n=1 Tax=Salvia splendens TaxID=180675 RepID=A0A8X8Z7J0_SALSN|nr:hypothetical protein SASPL_145281 [Salvia splendens]
MGGGLGLCFIMLKYTPLSMNYCCIDEVELKDDTERNLEELEFKGNCLHEDIPANPGIVCVGDTMYMFGGVIYSVPQPIEEQSHLFALGCSQRFRSEVQYELVEDPYYKSFMAAITDMSSNDPNTVDASPTESYLTSQTQDIISLDSLIRWVLMYPFLQQDLAPALPKFVDECEHLCFLQLNHRIENELPFGNELANWDLNMAIFWDEMERIRFFEECVLNHILYLKTCVGPDPKQKLPFSFSACSNQLEVFPGNVISASSSSLDWMSTAPSDVNHSSMGLTCLYMCETTDDCLLDPQGGDSLPSYWPFVHGLATGIWLISLLSPTSGMLFSIYNLPLPGHILICGPAGKQRSFCGTGPTVQSLTNFPQSLSCSGRFDFHINLHAPAAAERSAILKHEMEKRSLQCSDDLLSDIASKCDGYDAYDLKKLVNRSVHAAIGRSLSADLGSKENRKPTLIRDDFQQAMENFLRVAMRDITKPATEGGRSGWEDVGGLNDIRNAIKEMIELPSKYPNIFAQAPLRLRSNVLLYGPAGCGKTHIVGAAAAACSLRFISVKGPELLNKYIGASEQAVSSGLQKLSEYLPMDGDVDLDHVAQMTEGFSGADLQALLSAQLKRCPRGKQKCPHMLFYGPPGTGKTTTDLAIAHQLYGPELYRSRVLELNASDDCGINVVRTKIKNFAAVAVGSERQGGYPCPPYKIIILDEADSMTEDAQASVLVLRGAARLFGSSISSKDLISVSGVIPDGIMQALFTACKSGDFDIADKEVKNVIAEGYPASQMLNHLFDVVVESDDIPDDQKARMCKKFGEADKCLVDGADEYLQLLDVASNIMRALNNRRIPFRKLGACSSVETVKNEFYVSKICG